VARSAASRLPGLGVGLVAGLIFLPGACSAGVVAWALAGDGISPSQALLYGTLVGVAAWVGLAFPLRGLSSPRHANSGVYRELAARHKALAEIANAVDRKQDPEAWAAVDASLQTVRSSLAEDGAGGDGTAWAGGAAYIVVFTFLHRAEQALTMLLAEHDVVRQALYERSSLLGSKIANADEQVSRLEHAICALGGGEYLPGPRPAGAGGDKRLARGVVQDAQATVDDFRDSRRRGLVRARNRLFATVVSTGLVAYGGLGLALLAGAEKTQVVAGATFYLIGASVGLFRQLRQAAVMDAVTEEDFGLSMVRLVHIPLASGLAAIGGVVVTAYVTALNSSTEVPALSTVFDVADNPLGLVSAAVFGFTPSLLASSLQSRADKWKEELKSSAPGEKVES
jgi:hypothetical protein